MRASRAIIFFVSLCFCTSVVYFVPMIEILRYHGLFLLLAAPCVGSFLGVVAVLLPALSVIGLQPHHTPNTLFAGADKPNFFVDISGMLDTKIESIVRHESQMTRVKGWQDRVRKRAADTGKKGGLEYAEGFHLLELH